MRLKSSTRRGRAATRLSASTHHSTLNQRLRGQRPHMLAQADGKPVCWLGVRPELAAGLRLRVPFMSNSAGGASSEVQESGRRLPKQLLTRTASVGFVYSHNASDQLAAATNKATDGLIRRSVHSCKMLKLPSLDVSHIISWGRSALSPPWSSASASAGTRLCTYRQWFQGNTSQLLKLPLPSSVMRTLLRFKGGRHRSPNLTGSWADVPRDQRVCSLSAQLCSV